MCHDRIESVVCYFSSQQDQKCVHVLNNQYCHFVKLCAAMKLISRRVN